MIVQHMGNKKWLFRKKFIGGILSIGQKHICLTMQRKNFVDIKSCALVQNAECMPRLLKLDEFWQSYGG